MLLYLLRHGEAEPRATTDAARRLTDKGLADVRSRAQAFRNNSLQIDRCLCSPYTRTLQTARVFLDELPSGLPIEECEAITPNKRARQVFQLLESLPSASRVLLVTHNPLISELAALLEQGDIHNMAIMQTSELLAISIDVVGPGMGRQVLRLSGDMQATKG